MLNLFGKGFIGSEYANMYDVVVNEKDNYIPQTNNILYMISTTHNYNVFNDVHVDIDTNLNVLMTVLNNCRSKYGNNFTFNFVSSWFVYGNTDLPAKETSVCRPKGFYSITKKTAEDLLMSYCGTFGINYKIIRLCNVLGSSDKKVTQQRNALQYLIGRLKYNLPIEVYDNGEFYRDYMHVYDVVRAINLVTNHGNCNEIYNVGTGIPTLFKTLIDYAIEKTNSKSVVTYIPQKEFHAKVQVKSMYMECSKLKQLGFTQSKTLYETIDEIIENA